MRSFSPVALLEAAGRLVLHYPSWFLFVCAANRLEIFLYAYVSAHVLYLGRSSLTLLVKLGRPRAKARLFLRFRCRRRIVIAGIRIFRNGAHYFGGGDAFFQD